MRSIWVVAALLLIPSLAEAAAVCGKLATCDARCQKKDTAACLQAARQHAVRHEADAAAHAYERACRAGRVVACGELLLSMHPKGLLEQRDPTLAREIARLGCDGHDMPSCQRLAAMPVPLVELKAQAQVLREACATDDADACRELGAMIEHYGPATGIEPQPRDPIVKACDLDPVQCTLIADAAMMADKSDPERARRYYARAQPRLAAGCSAGKLAACMSLGVLLDRPSPAPTDNARSRTVLRRACQGGVDAACRVLALSTDDDAEATRLLTALCGKAGDEQARACLVLGGRAPDASTALPSFAKACELGRADGCRAAAHLIERIDKAQALDWMAQACKLAGEADASCAQAAVWRDELDAQKH